MGKTCPTGVETDPVHQRKPPKRPALPSQIFILADAAAMALAGAVTWQAGALAWPIAENLRHSIEYAGKL
jgi:hypothetical protein